ncbi:negative regulation of mitotic cell cycle [Pristimantis euphronides]
MTIWVDPFEVCCRYGEKNSPFTIASFLGKEDGNVSKRISTAVEKATSDHSGTSSDEEISIKEPKAIPTVINPNSIYQLHKFADYNQPTQTWSQFSRQKNYPNDGYQPTGHHQQHRAYKPYRQAGTFSGPLIDRYHWVNTRR